MTTKMKGLLKKKKTKDIWKVEKVKKEPETDTDLEEDELNITVVENVEAN